MTELSWHSFGTAGDARRPTLVLLHAFPLNSHMFSELIQALDPMPVITIDAPGFGGSELVEPSMSAYAAAITRTLEASGINRAVIAGISMGGYAAMEVAATNPDLFAGIALMDTNARADTAVAAQARKDMAARATDENLNTLLAPLASSLIAPGAGAEVRARVRSLISQAAPSGITWAQLTMAGRSDRADALAALGDAGVPAVVLRGAEDQLAGVAVHQQMAQLLNTTVETIDGAGHLSALEAPRAVATVLGRLWRTAFAGI